MVIPWPLMSQNAHVQMSPDSNTPFPSSSTTGSNLIMPSFLSSSFSSSSSSSSSSGAGARATTSFNPVFFLPRPELGVLAEAALPVDLVGVPGVAVLTVRARLGVGFALSFVSLSSPSLSSSSSSEGRPFRLRSSFSKAAIFFLIAPQALLTERGF